MKKIIILLSIITLLTSCKKETGCTDPTARNFNSSAEVDDGTCVGSAFSKSRFDIKTSISSKEEGTVLDGEDEGVTGSEEEEDGEIGSEEEEDGEIGSEGEDEGETGSEGEDEGATDSEGEDDGGETDSEEEEEEDISLEDRIIGVWNSEMAFSFWGMTDTQNGTMTFYEDGTGIEVLDDYDEEYEDGYDGTFTWTINSDNELTIDFDGEVVPFLIDVNEENKLEFSSTLIEEWEVESESDDAVVIDFEGEDIIVEVTLKLNK